MTEYSMEQLRETFLRHAEDANKSRDEHIANFIEINPDYEVPDHLMDDFNLPNALAAMCAEIIRVRDRQHN
jgi:hypothetical protein